MGSGILRTAPIGSLLAGVLAARVGIIQQIAVATKTRFGQMVLAVLARAREAQIDKNHESMPAPCPSTLQVERFKEHLTTLLRHLSWSRINKLLHYERF